MSDATLSAAAAAVSAPADGAMVEDPVKEEKEDQPEGKESESKEPDECDRFLAGCFMQKNKDVKGHYVLCRVLKNYNAPRISFSMKSETLKRYPTVLRKKTAILRKELKSLKGGDRTAVEAKIDDLQKKLKFFNENNGKITAEVFKGMK